MPNIGPTELAIILVIVLIFFGVGRLPEVGGAMGRGLREFKRASTGEYDNADKVAAPSETKEVAGDA
jgi:sec-independent protein translocase protein TatA